MKKLLTASLLSLATLALVNGRASAWLDLFHHCHKCCCEFTISCRPYNAFSPVCCGNVNYCGCCPGCVGGGPLACGQAGDGRTVTELPGYDRAFATAPGETTFPFQAPMPSPIGRPVPAAYGFPTTGWPTVVPNGYGPAYYPTATMGYGQ